MTTLNINDEGQNMTCAQAVAKHYKFLKERRKKKMKSDSLNWLSVKLKYVPTLAKS